MKRIVSIILALIMILSFAACGEIPETATKIGILTELVSSEDSNIVYYGDIQSLEIALVNGEIDEMGSLPECVAKYMADTRSGLKLQQNTSIAVNKFSFNLAVLKERPEVFRDLEEALETLEERGTLDKLKKEYIDSYFETGETPAPPMLPKYEDGKKLIVAVTGDYPLIDSFSANGMAEGLVRALLFEVANVKRLNIELIVLNSGSRMAALENKYVDAVICTTGYTYTGGQILNTSKIPDSISITMPFFTDDSASLVIK